MTKMNQMVCNSYAQLNYQLWIDFWCASFPLFARLRHPDKNPDIPEASSQVPAFRGTWFTIVPY